MNTKTAALSIIAILAGVRPAAAAAAGSASEPALAARTDVLLFSDFESDDWYRAWGARSVPQNCDLVSGEQALGGAGRSLRATVKKGSNWGTSLEYRFARQPGGEPDEIYFRYYLKFDPDWKAATFGGKLPGFGGTYGKAGWGGRRVNGRDGWSARGLFADPKGGSTCPIGYYCYHADMTGQYGSEWRFTPALELGRWYCVEMYCKLNTPAAAGEAKGRNDGILRAWIDGQQAYEKTDIRFRDVPELKIELVWLDVYHGGSGVPPEDIHVYFDNLVIARKPIGPLKRDMPVIRPIASKEEQATTGPASPPPATVIKPEALAAWNGKLVERVMAAVKNGQRPLAFLRVMGAREERVQITGADAKSLTVNLMNNDMPVAWGKLSNADRLSLAQSFLVEGNAPDHVLVAVFALASGRAELADTEFAKAVVADAKDGPALAAAARDSLK